MPHQTNVKPHPAKQQLAIEKSENNRQVSQHH